MPSLILVTTSGFNNNYYLFQLTVFFSFVTFPYLLFISLASFYGSILNSFQKFFPFSIAPVILNLIMISSILFFDMFGTYGHNLSFATLIGGILELIWMQYFLTRNKCNIYFTKIKRNSKVYKIFKRIGPMLISSGVTYINTWTSTIILSFFSGAISYFYYAERIIQLPISLIGIAISVVILPIVSKNFTEHL